VLISTGHLGTAPSNPESFHLGMASNPDYIVADAGSSDPGPVYLGEDTTLGHFVRDDLELFVTAARRQKIPLVIGSAGDTGSNRGVNEFIGIIQELALEHRLPKFRVGYFYSEVPKDYLEAKLRAGHTLAGLGGFPDLTASRSTRPAASSLSPACIRSSSCCAAAPWSSSPGAAATCASPRVRASITAFPSRSPITWAR
jgi:hypothetical protein